MTIQELEAEADKWDYRASAYALCEQPDDVRRCVDNATRLRKEAEELRGN